MSFALIPACGKSQRMGKPKLSLPLGDKTVLEHVVASIRSSDVETILVIIGPHVAELKPLVSRAGARCLCLGGETPDMRRTVEEGLQFLQKEHNPSGEDFWMLIPGDSPSVDGALARELIVHYQSTTKPSIVVPAFNGKRGHPCLLSWALTPCLLRFEADKGINAFLRSREDITHEVPVSDVSVLEDMDEPLDYARLKEKWNRH